MSDHLRHLIFRQWPNYMLVKTFRLHTCP